MRTDNIEDEVERILITSEKEIMKRVLLLGQMALSENQFKAFRKEIFDLFGPRDLRRVVREIIEECLSSKNNGLGEGRRFSEFAKEG